MPNQNKTEHYGGGQSGYGAGRVGEDRAMGPGFRNQAQESRRGEPSHDDRQGMHTDDRFTGRGGEGYWEDREEREYADDYGTAMRRSVGASMRGRDDDERFGGNVGQEGYTRSDDRIREDVNEALTQDDHVDTTHVEVIVHNGEVTLTGTIEDRPMKRLAEDVAERIVGVRDVHNHLRIRGNPKLEDAVGRFETETSTMEKKHRA
jgi:osmotically-inducible protein OsmY